MSEISETIQTSIAKLHTAAAFLSDVATGPASGTGSIVENPIDGSQQKTVANVLAAVPESSTFSALIESVQTVIDAAQEATANDLAINDLDITNLSEKPIGAIFPTTSGNVIQDLAYSEDGKTMYVTQDVSGDILLTVIKNYQVVDTINLGDKGHGEGLFFAPYMGKRRLFLADSVPSATIWLLSEDLWTSTAITVTLPTAADSGWLKSNYCEESKTLICRYVDATGGQHVTLYDWDDSLANPIGAEGLTITLNDVYIANNPLQAIAIDSSNVYTISGTYELASADRISKLAIYDRETGLEVSAHDILLDVDVASNYGDKYEPEGATWYNLPNGKKELHFGLMMGLTGDNRHYISSFTNEPLSGTKHFTLNMADDTITPYFDSNYPAQSSETFVSIHKVNDNISGGTGAQIFTRQASNMGACQGDANLTSHGIITSYRYGFDDEIEKDIRIYDFGRESGTDVTRIGVDDSEIGQNNRIYGNLIF